MAHPATAPTYGSTAGAALAVAQLARKEPAAAMQRDTLGANL